MVWGRPPTREGRAGSGAGPSRAAPPGRVRGSQDDSGARWQGNIPAGRAGAAAAGPSARSASAQRRPAGRWGTWGSAAQWAIVHVRLHPARSFTGMWGSPSKICATQPHYRT